MKKFIPLIVIAVLTGCAESEDDDSSNDIDPAGIYQGEITPTSSPPFSAVGLITSAGDVAIIATDIVEGLIGLRTGSSFSGTLFTSTPVPAAGELTSVTETNLSGRYSSALGGGSFALTADRDLYDRGASLAKLDGTWTDSDFILGDGTPIWDIEPSGSFILSTTASCDGYGVFSLIDETKNEYSFDLTLTNCADLNGVYAGIAYLFDTIGTDDSLFLIYTDGTIAGISSATKP